MDKEIRAAFGEFGDFNPNLEKMFGKAYLDYPDTSKSNLPKGLSNESNLYNVGDLFERAIELSPNIDCKLAQNITLKFLKGYISGEDSITHEEWFTVIKHIGDCSQKDCHDLYNIAIMDNLITGQVMDKLFGDKIRNWKVE